MYFVLRERRKPMKNNLKHSRFLNLRLLTRYANRLQSACCGFAQLITRMPAVVMNTVWHAGDQLRCASLALFVTYLRSGLVLLLLLLPSCGYQTISSTERPTISIPYVRGDEEGFLTNAVISEINRTGMYDYVNSGGE